MTPSSTDIVDIVCGITLGAELRYYAAARHDNPYIVHPTPDNASVIMLAY
jgi:hypothetical protein